VARTLRPGGALFVEDFTRRDPGCEGEGPASEFAPLVRHYFGTEELPDLFAGLETLQLREIEATDTAHGGPHRHALVRYAARRPESPPEESITCRHRHGEP
jgi:hypothetical protein